MKSCHNCHVDLMDNAAFCHACGVKVVQAYACPKCATINPPDARFCYKCGGPIDLTFTRSPKYSASFQVDFKSLSTLPTQLLKSFESFLLLVLEDEQAISRKEEFLQRLQNSDFKEKHLEELCVLLTQELEQLLEEPNFNLALAELKITRLFTWQIDVFFSKYCAELTSEVLPFSLNSLQNIGEESLVHLVTVYLEADRQPDNFFFRAIDIPFKVLQKAQTSFYKPAFSEQPHFFVNQTFFPFNAGKEGVVISDRAIYWKSFLHPPATVPFNQLDSIVYFPDRIEINGIFLNIDKRTNYLLYKLLHRLRVRFRN